MKYMYWLAFQSRRRHHEPENHRISMPVPIAAIAAIAVAAVYSQLVTRKCALGI